MFETRPTTANPSGTFRVIVTQKPAKDRSDRRGKAAQVEADIAGGGGRVTRRLDIIDGVGAVLDAPGANRFRANAADPGGCPTGDRQHADHHGDRNRTLGHDSDGDDADHDSHRPDPLGLPKGTTGRMPLPR